MVHKNAFLISNGRSFFQSSNKCEIYQIGTCILLTFSLMLRIKGGHLLKKNVYLLNCFRLLLYVLVNMHAKNVGLVKDCDGDVDIAECT